MSRCGKTHLLEAVVQGEVPGDDLRAHAAHCPRCRHELNWLETEQGLFRQRAAREEVSALWKGVAVRTGVAPRRSINRALVGLAAALFVVLGVGRGFVEGPSSSSGRDASVADSAEAFMTENAITQERANLCSRSAEQGIGFHCGYVPASLIASR
ncbi:MAG: hypothetical protein Q8S33_34470 [Myxococcales bacterium]|nr:hypothetical protein [Myxococcales bacterium]